jgi:hypothetical protein
VSKWQQQRGEASQQGFMDLFHNRCAYVALEDFLTSAECQAAVKVLRDMGLKQYDYNFNVDEAPPAAHLFTTHYLFEPKQPSDYFPVAAEAIKQYEQLVGKAGFNPVKKIMELLQQQLQKSVAVAEQEGQQYSYVIARELNHSVLLHADYAHFIPEYWSISKVIAQYAWNIYLTDPGEGGETVVYNRPWEKADDQYILHDTYGYDKKLVANAECITFRPTPGTLMFFNSRNFHEVAKCTKPRLTMGGHIGLTENDEVIFWV